MRFCEWCHWPIWPWKDWVTPERHPGSWHGACFIEMKRMAARAIDAIVMTNAD